jgi:hypothetical protein
MTLPSTVAFFEPSQKSTQPPTFASPLGPRMLRKRLLRTTQLAEVWTDIPWL